jgi:site-specific recombinase XerD
VGAFCGGCSRRPASRRRSRPGKLRNTHATNLLNAGAERVGIKARLGHESIVTTQVYTNVGQEWIE